MATSAAINAWLAANPNASQSDIYHAMVQSGTTPQDLSSATGWDLGAITSDYNGFANQAAAPATPAPAPDPYAPRTLTAPTRGSLTGLLGGASAGVSGGGVGTAHYNAPTFDAPTLNTSYTQGPYIQAMADAIGKQSQLALGQAMQGIQGDAIGIGGLGGSRQGIAQGTAAGQANNALQANLANLYNTDYNNTLNRQLQQYNSELGSATSRYGADTGAAASMYGADTGAAASMYDARLGANAAMYGANLNYGLGQDKLGLDQYQGDQTYNLGLGSLGNNSLNNQMDFYTAQRGQDLAQLGLGAQLYGQGNTGYLSQGLGLQTLGNAQQTAPQQNLANYANILNQYTGLGGQTTSTQGGGGSTGALGGAIAGSLIQNNLGFGGGSTNTDPAFQNFMNTSSFFPATA